MYGKNTSRSESGFTLVELLTVLVIMGALSVAIALRWEPRDSSLPAQADQLGRVLRHAQALAMHQGRTLTLDIQSATTYAVTDGAASIRDPGGELLAYALVEGATLSGSDVSFDSLGRPINGSPGTLSAAAQSWTLNAGSSSASVTLQPLTGFVTVTP